MFCIGDLFFLWPDVDQPSDCPHVFVFWLVRVHITVFLWAINDRDTDLTLGSGEHYWFVINTRSPLTLETPDIVLLYRI